MPRVALSDNSKPSSNGFDPEQLSIEQRLASGFILLDKPPGPTSHQIASWVRDMLGLERLGHGGTLDPFATGVLPLMAGKSMKLTKGILQTNKTYIAVLKFAQVPKKSELSEIIGKMTGRIYNVPPEISAVKVQVRTRRIFNFELIELQEKEAVVKIVCEAGTYIRTIARDMGLMLGFGVKLKELRRENSGRFSLEDCVTLQQIADAIWLWKECDKPEAISKIIHPTEKLLLDKPYIIVKDSAASALCHGAPLLRPGLIEVSSKLSSGLEVAAFTSKNEIVGIVKMTKGFQELSTSTNGEVGKPVMILMEQDRYPPQWNK